MPDSTLRKCPLCGGMLAVVQGDPALIPLQMPVKMGPPPSKEEAEKSKIVVLQEDKASGSEEKESGPDG